MHNHSWTALAAFSILSLAACSPKAEQKAENATNATASAIANAANATSNVVSNAALAVKPTPTGQEFADTAAKSDAFEIAAAKLAATNSSSPDVKAFAKMMIAAHTESTVKIKSACKAADPAITPDPALTDDQNDKLAKLKDLKGDDFDKAYIDGQVSAHEDALSLMKKYAADGTVPSLKTAAGEIEPVVQNHLDAAHTLKDGNADHKTKTSSE